MQKCDVICKKDSDVRREYRRYNCGKMIGKECSYGE